MQDKQEESLRSMEPHHTTSHYTAPHYEEYTELSSLSTADAVRGHAVKRKRIVRETLKSVEPSPRLKLGQVLHVSSALLQLNIDVAALLHRKYILSTVHAERRHSRFVLKQNSVSW